MVAAYAQWFEAGTVFLCVVDPGVGGTRPAIILEADGRWYVGPGNGLFELVQRRATTTRSWDIAWKPERLSASFHGRDLFAPVAAILARGEPPPGRPRKNDMHRRADWPDDLCEVVYIDHFGNAMTGLRALVLPPDAGLVATGRVLEPARTFSDRPPGTAFWYENSNGLVEIAVNQGRADRELGLTIGNLAETEGHHPDVSFGWGYATISLRTKKIKGLHENDFIMASKIDRIFDAPDLQ